MKRIGIIDAGQLGAILAKRLTSTGHPVKIINSRGASSLRYVARQTGATGVDLQNIVAEVDVLILAIPFGKTGELPEAVVNQIGPDMVVIDAGNYVPVRDGNIKEIDHGMPEATWVSWKLGISVVKAFNSVSDITLEQSGRPAGDPDRIALPVAGDDARARAVVMKLIDGLGFDPWDAGPLSGSWRQQIGQPAYCTDGTIKQLPGLLSRAKSETVVPNRQGAMRLMGKLAPDFPKATLIKAARFIAGLDRGKASNWWAVMQVAKQMAVSRSNRATH